MAATGAFVYAKAKPAFVWLTGIGVFVVVFAMVMVWGRIYNARLFGIGGTIILVAFFAIVWLWMKTVAMLDDRAKVAASFKLIGYIFWINTSWFLCGETARMHLTAFADGARIERLLGLPGDSQIEFDALLYPRAPGAP